MKAGKGNGLPRGKEWAKNLFSLRPTIAKILDYGYELPF
jgi:hypothetical protein